MNKQMFFKDAYCKTFSYNSGSSNLSSDHHEENPHIFAMTSFTLVSYADAFLAQQNRL